MSQKNSLLEKAFSATESFVVKLHNFIMLARNRDSIICVFEGDDHFYYAPRIDAHLPYGKTRYNFPMGGKNNVVELYELKNSNNNVKNANAIFFIDNDFDFNGRITSGKLYVTPCYSIENLYTSDYTVRKILNDIFKISTNVTIEEGIVVNQEFEKIMNIFIVVMAEIHEKFLLPLNAFILAAKEEVIKSSFNISSGKLCIKDLSLNEYVNASLCSTTYNKASTLYNFSISLNAKNLVTQEKYDEKLKFLRSRDILNTCRGKYTFEIFSSLLEELWKDSKKSVPKIFLKKKEARLSFSRNTALADLSPYAQTPECLKDFLRENFLA